jgi:hypothetical protein
MSQWLHGQWAASIALYPAKGGARKADSDILKKAKK